MEPGVGTGKSPFPERIIDRTGSCFSLDVIGGTTFYFLKGIYNSPKGRRIISGTQAVITKVPSPIGESLAVWGATVSSLECAMFYARQKKEDPWNSIVAGFTAGGLFAMHRGLRPAMLESVLFGGLFALFEGVHIMTDRFLPTPLRPMQLEDHVASPPPPPPGLLSRATRRLSCHWNVDSSP